MQISTWDLRRHSPWHTTPVKHSFSGVLWSLATTCNSDLCLLFLSQLEAKKWKTKSLTRSLRLASTSYVPLNFQTCKSIWEKDKKVDSLAEHAAVCSCRRLFFCRRRLLYLNQTQISCGVGWKLAPPPPPLTYPLTYPLLSFSPPLVHPCFRSPNPSSFARILPLPPLLLLLLLGLLTKSWTVWLCLLSFQPPGRRLRSGCSLGPEWRPLSTWEHEHSQTGNKVGF